uniref:Uncharacterized protein n=1 Tax=Coccidioides posadasii RMSCC 3488 TaxID=454284 RepID=A0A0J6IKT9_COCPO|nr:hypothetical protein CPAG_08881 [Coccidioides posadasii RMSCC 3488]
MAACWCAPKVESNPSNFQKKDLLSSLPQRSTPFKVVARISTFTLRKQSPLFLLENAMYTYTENNKYLVLLPQAHAVAQLGLGLPPQPSPINNTTESAVRTELPMPGAGTKTHRSPSTGANMTEGEKALECGFLKLGP